jgi:hypothetical protein
MLKDGMSILLIPIFIFSHTVAVAKTKTSEFRGVHSILYHLSRML